MLLNSRVLCCARNQVCFRECYGALLPNILSLF
jgi:hypothetical protein